MGITDHRKAIQIAIQIDDKNKDELLLFKSNRRNRRIARSKVSYLAILNFLINMINFVGLSRVFFSFFITCY